MKILSIRQIIMRLVIIIASAELLIMILFINLPFTIGPYAEILLDTAILVIVSVPTIYILIVRPYITASEAFVLKIEHMAYHDSLTGLANRRLLSEYLEKLLSSLLRYKSYGAVLFIDLDGFKRVNDEYGHDAGDIVLTEVANRLKLFARTEDIVSRPGGDEFILVLSQLGTNEQIAKDKAVLVSERIQQELRKKINVAGMELQVGSSLRLRLLKPEGANVDRVLADADAAMYLAKKENKSGMVFFKQEKG
ncbi:MAG: GGDEF domain-containing protein [Cycloclasticus sp.]|nr:GGDEF domain-containing protein [Cycloclasticus sp.]